MRIFKLKPLSVCDTNCYIVASQQNNAVLIDAPADADYIIEQLEFYGVTLKKIFITHGHFDHIGAVADLVEKTGCEVYIDIFDKNKLSDNSGALANLFRIAGYRSYTGEVNTFNDGDILTLDELEFKVMETPGHSSGSVCFICQDNIFTGDTLFAKSQGRTDFPDGDEELMKKSLAKIASIEEDLHVYPGHMSTSTLKEEKRFNPYLIYSGENR